MVLYEVSGIEECDGFRKKEERGRIWEWDPLFHFYDFLLKISMFVSLLYLACGYLYLTFFVTFVTLPTSTCCKIVSLF